jgi:hypothetical protein
VIQTVLAAQLVSRGLIDGTSGDNSSRSGGGNGATPNAADAKLPTSLATPAPAKR